MNQRPQHKVVYNIPGGAEGGFVRVEVLSPLGMTASQCREAVEAYLASHPGAMVLSRTWSDRGL